MSEVILFFLTYFLALVTLVCVLIGVLRFVIEPTYVLIFNKPLYLYWYPVPKKLKLSQKLILEKEFPFYKKLSDKRKTYFEHRVKSFLQYYQFLGNDIHVTEEMKVIIAGTYIMLTFGIRQYLVPLFQKIIIYPSQYFSTITEHYHKGEYNPKLKAVVFSWEDFLLGHQTSNDNVNLGLHEFAHVLHFHSIRAKDISASIFYDEFNEL